MSTHALEEKTFEYSINRLEIKPSMPFPLPRGDVGLPLALPSTKKNMNENVVLAKGAVEAKIAMWLRGKIGTKPCKEAWAERHD